MVFNLLKESYLNKNMMIELIGRHKEIEILNHAFHSQEAEMVAIIGRRRVGKTFLVRNVFNKNLDLEVTNQ
jgi:hypothetical protein